MIYVFLADGFETIEALAPLDMLRRAGIDVQTVGVSGKTVHSCHQVAVEADINLTDAETHNLEGIILPGGSVGTDNLEASPVVHQYIDYCSKNNLLIAAICAAPSILGKKGLLDDIKATAYPSLQKYITNLSDEFVVKENNFITARGAGVSIEFGLAIVSYLRGAGLSDEIREAIQWKK